MFITQDTDKYIYIYIYMCVCVYIYISTNIPLGNTINVYDQQLGSFLSRQIPNYVHSLYLQYTGPTSSSRLLLQRQSCAYYQGVNL